MEPGLAVIDAGWSGSHPAERSTAFETLLAQLCDDPALFTQPVGVAIHRLLTFDGRLPLAQGLESLWDVECEVVQALMAEDTLRLTPLPEAGDRAMSLRVFCNGLGRLHLRPVDEPIPTYHRTLKTYPVGFLAIPRTLFEQALQSATPGQAEEALLRAELDALLLNLEQEGHIHQLLSGIDDAVRHVETVALYVDDELFSVKERCTNLIGRGDIPGLLEELGRKPVRFWTPAQRLVVVALRALFLSGRSVRFEEFNGQMLTARRLLARLRQLADQYDEAGLTVAVSRRDGLFEWAEAIGRAASKSVSQPLLRYRWGCGLTFCKTERVLLQPDDVEGEPVVPRRFLDLAESWLGQPIPQHLPAEDLFDELAAVALSAPVAIPEAGRNTPARRPVEFLMQEIVASALSAANADYAMSSALRDIRPLLVADDQELPQAMLRLRPADFYCCIVSRSGLRERFGPQLAEHIYRSVQARMQFNRWHFIAGNFRNVPRERHYYYPPLTPDLSEWSDMHHSGHTRAGVRYSVRAPGPDMSQPPLRIGAHDYRGFYDVRVVRMYGPAFTLRDLLVTRRHCLWMGVVWRRIVAQAERRPGSVTITGFANGHGYEAVAPMAIRQGAVMASSSQGITQPMSCR